MLLRAATTKQACCQHNCSSVVPFAGLRLRAATTTQVCCQQKRSRAVAGLPLEAATAKQACCQQSSPERRQQSAADRASAERTRERQSKWYSSAPNVCLGGNPLGRVSRSGIARRRTWAAAERPRERQSMCATLVPRRNPLESVSQSCTGRRRTWAAAASTCASCRRTCRPPSPRRRS